jgi:phage terminase large subunit-like protein
MPNLLRLTYGVWNTGVSPWLQGPDWHRCVDEFAEEDLYGQQCFAGVDWSKTKDMTALALVFPDEDNPEVMRQLVYYWMPEATILERQHLIDYRAWVKSGHLRIGGEKVNETAHIEAEMAEILEQYVCMQVAFDPMYVDETRLGEVFPDAEAVKFPQTIMQFAGPTAEYERLILNGQLLHNDNPVLTWQAGHCTVKSDLNNNKRPVKPKHGDIRTIDGIVAGIMALRLVMAENGESAYASDDAIYCVDDLYSSDNEEEVSADGELV